MAVLFLLAAYVAASDAVWFALIAMVGTSIAAAIAAYVKVNELKTVLEKNRQAEEQENVAITRKVEQVKKHQDGCGESDAIKKALADPQVAKLFKAALHEEFKDPRAAEHLVRNILQNRRLLLELAKLEREAKAQEAGDHQP